ncbi:MAG: radical SAM protein [Candidatus Fermentibacter sp.]|nr:radical SAM protein [Candidatus Fermentibacter sp.]
MVRVGFLNLGCRLNACETEWLAARKAEDSGGEVAASPLDADLIVLGTCCVTSRSQSKSRKAARRLLAETSAGIVLAGCSARLFPGDFPKDRRITREDCPEGPVHSCRTCRGARNRGLLRIQDGCSNRCTYCVVPDARGPSRSYGRSSILDAAGSMADAGFREIVLTGADIVSYGRDLGDSRGLPGLVGDLVECGRFRVRLGSLEPMGLAGTGLRALALPGVCRHVHLSIQSGSTQILRRMGRACSGADVADMAREARNAFPGGIVGCDLIAGFPGETAEDFEQSLALLTGGLVDYAHVFPFSPRPGTPASGLPDRVPAHEVSRRAAVLRRASTAGRRRFERAQEGRRMSVLVENRCRQGMLTGISDNYVAVAVPDGAVPGSLMDIVPSHGEIIPFAQAGEEA